MTGRQLEVCINEQVVGFLREANDLWTFEYAQAWAASPEGFDLSPALSREKPVHADGASQRPVQWYFDNLLPEEALRTVIASEADISANDAFGLLAWFGAESAGSLVLRSPGATGALAQGLRPLPFDELSQRIARLPATSLTRDAPKRMSLAGAQHKMLVVYQNGQLFEPLPGTPSTHILKPNHPGEDYPASVMNEFFTMRLAAAVGLDVPAVHRLCVPQPVYIIERFDRLQTPGQTPGQVQRRHAIDTCQLLNKSRAFKYSSANLESLAGAIAHCRSKALARLRLYRWVVFNALVGNGDNHLKNISFLVDASGIQVAPAYDLLCTSVYETIAMANERARWPATQLAFSLGKAQSFSQLTRAHLVDAGKVIGVNEATATRELDRLSRLVPVEADKLLAGIEAHMERDWAASPDPEKARAYAAGELRMLRAIQKIVIFEMAGRMGPGR